MVPEVREALGDALSTFGFEALSSFVEARILTFDAERELHQPPSAASGGGGGGGHACSWARLAGAMEPEGEGEEEEATEEDVDEREAQWATAEVEEDAWEVEERGSPVDEMDEDERWLLESPPDW